MKKSSSNQSKIKGKDDCTGAGIFRFFLNSYRVTYLLIIGLAIVGIVTLINLPQESTPEIKVPFGFVATAYPGAAARDVEELVTNKIETRLENLSGLKELSSSSSIGLSTIEVQFQADEDLDESLRKLREAVDGVTDLPSEALDPQVIELDFNSQPIITIGLGGIKDERLLTVYAQELSDRLKTIPDVSSVDVVGGLDEQIVLIADPAVLASKNVGINQIIGSIKASNINAPFGSLETEGFNYDLRLEGNFSNISDVAAIPIRLPSGEINNLDQLVDVSLRVSEKSNQSRISLNNQASTPAVSISVTKKTGGNIVNIVEAVMAEIETAQSTYLPSDITVETFADRAADIDKSITDVTKSGLQTLVIVLIVLWLFLGWKEASVAAFAIPLSFFIAFIVFELTDTTLNGISMFSLILGLGLLVDNSIVMVEGIHRGVGKSGLRQHAANIVDQFKKPLIGGTLTTVAAFFPMLLVSGIMGEFLKVIPIVVTSTLLSSLFVSLAFIPAVAVGTMRNATIVKKERWFDKQFKKFKKKYHSFIVYILNRRKLQTKGIWTLTLLLILGLALPFSGLLSTGLFPAQDIYFMIINYELPPGANLDSSAVISAQIEERLLQVPEVKSFSANIGSSSSIDFGGNSSSAHLGSFYINLAEDRDRSSLEIASELRTDFDKITEAKIKVEELSAGPPTAPPVEVKLIGPDLNTLNDLSLEAMDELEKIPGTIEIDRSVRNSSGEFTFSFNNAALATNGLTSAQVAGTLRSLIFGSEVTTFLDKQSEEVSIMIEASENTVDSINNILSIPLTTVTGSTVTLAQVADVQLNTSLNSIRHRDGERTVTITADADDTTTPNEITAQLQPILDNFNLPDGYRFDVGGEQEETAQTFADLYRSMFIAVILILIILVIEFNSYRQPLIIFLSVPLALIGVLFGLLIFGGQLNFAAFIGLVSLTGIVVNNAILLVDRMNYFMKKGKSAYDAVRKAAESRLRPVILTTITTAAGVAPLIFVDEFFRDVALTIITGLLFSSILTLVFIPVLYLRQQQKIERKKLRAA